MRKVEKRERKKHDRGIVDFMMITSLILIKQFNRIRLQGNYWCVILDDTGLFYFKKGIVRTVWLQQNGRRMERPSKASNLCARRCFVYNRTDNAFM